MTVGQKHEVVSSFFEQAEREASIGATEVQHDTSRQRDQRKHQPTQEERRLQEDVRAEPNKVEALHALRELRRVRRRKEGTYKLQALAKHERRKGASWNNQERPMIIEVTATHDRYSITKEPGETHNINPTR